jgi:hypothetical protein
MALDIGVRETKSDVKVLPLLVVSCYMIDSRNNTGVPVNSCFKILVTYCSVIMVRIGFWLLALSCAFRSSILKV